MVLTDNPLILLVPEPGIEPGWAQGPEDFESSASTSFTTPALSAQLHLDRNVYTRLAIVNKIE